MATAHFILQGKGGVGKSFVSAILAQYFNKNGIKVHCADTDPINATFESYEEFSVKHINLFSGGNNIVVQSEFDGLIELICEAGEDEHIVIDNGASSFIPLINYIVENNALELLKSMGHKICLHSIITGGPALRDTLAGFDLLAKEFSKDADIFIWLNEFFGEVEADEKKFEQMIAYKNNAKSVVGIVTIRKQSELFLTSLKKALNLNLSLEAAINQPEIKVMDKQRLKMIQKDLFEQLDPIFNKNQKVA